MPYSTLIVPTNDKLVRKKLRQLGEPITLFGERVWRGCWFRGPGWAHTRVVLCICVHRRRTAENASERLWRPRLLLVNSPNKRCPCGPRGPHSVPHGGGWCIGAVLGGVCAACQANHHRNRQGACLRGSQSAAVGSNVTGSVVQHGIKSCVLARLCACAELPWCCRATRLSIAKFSLPRAKERIASSKRKRQLEREQDDTVREKKWTSLFSRIRVSAVCSCAMLVPVLSRVVFCSGSKTQPVRLVTSVRSRLVTSRPTLGWSPSVHG